MTPYWTNVLLPSDPPFTFSQSSLQDYLDCPRRFQLRYIQGLPWPAAAAEPLPLVERHQREARLFHRLVQQHFIGIPHERLAPTTGSPDLARWWSNFSAAAPELAGWTLHTEKTLSSWVGAHRLVCKYDLVAIREGKALIYDWKTSTRRPKNEWLDARMQTIAYRATVVRAGAELNGGHPFAARDVAMIYWYAEFPNDSVVLGYDERQFSRDCQSLEALVHEIADAAAFPLTNDPQQCRLCTYRSLCDRGQQAGTDPTYDAEDIIPPALDDQPGQIGDVQL
jgi:CRISPR/Cas system-associated exonuclease Cas4 (RecB family)